MVEETRNAPYFNGEDRISRLQDELIHYILSFIDTKYAVQTSVLSKRWIDIWKCLPFLKFCRSSFPQDKKDSFIQFVDMVLFFRQDIDIQKFVVDWRNSAYDNSVVMNVNRWSLAAVKYNVKEVAIQITQCHDSAYEIPHRLLNCRSLRMLCMYVSGNARYADIILPGSLSLPQLKAMCLIGLSISNVESSKRLFSSCPVLRMLRLVGCNIQTDNQRHLIVESLSLKKFEYFDYRSTHLLPQNDTTVGIVKLCAPNLEVFTCNSFLTQDYSLENCSPLSGVSFHMKLKAKKEDENAGAYSKLPSTEKDVYAKRIMKFLGAVYMVKEMRLSPGFLEVLSQAPDLSNCQPPPRLCNLKHLTLEMWCTRGCLRAIAYLLSISPKLTKIFLESKESNLEDVGDDWDAGLSLPGMLPYLKFVQIKKVEGCKNELRILSFVLKNAMVLKKVVLYPRSTIKSPNRARKQFRDKLRALPRASSHIRMEWPATKSVHIIK